MMLCGVKTYSSGHTLL